MTATELSSAVQTTKNSAPFRHILVATDFSEASRRALCDALTLAADYNAQLSVVHVVHHDRSNATLESPPELDLERAYAQERIAALIDELGTEQKITTILVNHGPVVEAVVRVIKEGAVDILVIGTRGRGGLQKLALGSVAEQLLRVAPCPVMTIGPKADIAAIMNGPGFHSILFATDFGQGSERALPLALMLAREHEAKFILLHMTSPMPATTGSLSAYAPAPAAADEVDEWVLSSRNKALKTLKECLPAETGLRQEPEYVVGTDFLAEGLLTAASQFKVDLIVMGANRVHSARVAAHNPWTAVHEVVENAPCPVLTVAG